MNPLVRGLRRRFQRLHEYLPILHSRAHLELGKHPDGNARPTVGPTGSMHGVSKFTVSCHVHQAFSLCQGGHGGKRGIQQNNAPRPYTPTPVLIYAIGVYLQMGGAQFI